MRDANAQVVGRCSICGGRVTVPMVYWSVIPPVPTCEQCGAVEAHESLPIIPMRPVWPWGERYPATVPDRWTTTDTTYEVYMES